MSANAGRITSRIWLTSIFVFLYLPILRRHQNNTLLYIAARYSVVG